MKCCSTRLEWMKIHSLLKVTEESCHETISSKSRLNSARAGSRPRVAPTVQPVPSPTVSTSFRKRSMCHLDTRQNCVNNSTKINIVRTVWDVNLYTRRSWANWSNWGMARMKLTSSPSLATSRSSPRTLSASNRGLSAPRTHSLTSSI